MAEKDSPVLGLHSGRALLQHEDGRRAVPGEHQESGSGGIHSLCWRRRIASSAGMPLRNLPGAMQFGKYVTSKGVLASVGHTQAEFEDILTAYEAGYTHATHFYNAMPGFHKRREYKYEGTVESIYLLDDMTVEVVADGIHVPPTILRLVYKIKGVERTCLITDALGLRRQ